MPSHVGTDRIDKAMLGSNAIDAMYLGTDKVYPNITTWEKWQPAWPEATGSTSSILDNDEGWPLNFDGTEGARNDVKRISIGKAFRNSNPLGYYLKTSSNQMRRYPDGQPMPIKSTYIEDVEHTDEDAYPTDGVHSDQFWYVLK